MVHTFAIDGNYYLFDVGSGALHICDALTSEVVKKMQGEPYDFRGADESAVREIEEEILRLRSGAMADERAKEIKDWAPQITTGIPIMIPETYVKDLGVRLGLYKRIGELKTADEIADMREELVDRFGPIPTEVDNLLKTVEIKQLCEQAGIEKIDAGAKGILITLRGNSFAQPEKLMDFIFSSFGAIKVRPDQKLFIEKDLSEYAVRVETIKHYVSKIRNLLN